MQRKVFVDTAKAGDEMVFERAYSTFGGVAAMSSGLNELVVDAFGGDVGLERRRAFVV